MTGWPEQRCSGGGGRLGGGGVDEIDIGDCHRGLKSRAGLCSVVGYVGSWVVHEIKRVW